MIFAHYLYFFFVYEIIFVLCKLWSPLYLQLLETVHSASFITGFFNFQKGVTCLALTNHPELNLFLKKKHPHLL